MLKRLDLASGTVLSLTPAEGGRGGAWAPDGTIVFQPTAGTTAMRAISASGGESRELGVGPGRFPHFLSDGRHFVYSRTFGGSNTETRGLYIASLDGGDPSILVEQADSAGVYTQAHVFYVRDGVLVSQRVDEQRFAVVGDPVPVAGNMSVNSPLWLSPIAASASGQILYRTGASGGQRQLVWIDRTGHELSKVGRPIANTLNPSLSTDGRHVVFHRTVDGNADIWMLNTSSGNVTRLTSAVGAQYYPLWAPDGKRVLFASGGFELAQKSAGGGPEEALFTYTRRMSPNDWSSDGRVLLITLNESDANDTKTISNRDVVAVPLATKAPIPVADTAFSERDAKFSPDGRWVAYSSDETERDEVYVQRFPERADRFLLSAHGGGMVQWRRDGREIFYVDLERRLMSVALQTRPDGTLVPGVPAPLFETRLGAPVQTNSGQQYMVSADGRRFLVNRLEEENADPITVILNWRR